MTFLLVFVDVYIVILTVHALERPSQEIDNSLCTVSVCVTKCDGLMFGLS